MDNEQDVKAGMRTLVDEFNEWLDAKKLEGGTPMDYFSTLDVSADDLSVFMGITLSQMLDGDRKQAGTGAIFLVAFGAFIVERHNRLAAKTAQVN